MRRGILWSLMLVVAAGITCVIPPHGAVLDTLAGIGFGVALANLFIRFSATR